jgi:hypothetical protein
MSFNEARVDRTTLGLTCAIEIFCVMHFCRDGFVATEFSLHRDGVPNRTREIGLTAFLPDDACMIVDRRVQEPSARKMHNYFA